MSFNSHIVESLNYSDFFFYMIFIVSEQLFISLPLRILECFLHQIISNGRTQQFPLWEPFLFLLPFWKQNNRKLTFPTETPPRMLSATTEWILIFFFPILALLLLTETDSALITHGDSGCSSKEYQQLLQRKNVNCFAIFKGQSSFNFMQL